MKRYRISSKRLSEFCLKKLFPLAALSLIASLILGVWLLIILVPGQISDGSGPSSSYSKAALTLAQLTASNALALAEAAKAARLVQSSNIHGGVDGRQELSDGSIQLSGWVLDEGDNGQPITLIGFAGGTSFSVIQSNGRRPDVEAAYKLSGIKAANVAFKINFRGYCAPGLLFLIIAVNQRNQFAALPFYNVPHQCR